MQLVKQIQLKQSKILEELCHYSKNLFNVANYVIRQNFFKKRGWVRYTELYHHLNSHPVYQKFHLFAGSHPPQQVLKQVDQAWNSFFQAIRSWKKNPSKFLGKPKLPRYKPKKGKNLVIFTKLQCRIQDGQVLLTNKLMNRGFPKINTVIKKIAGVRIVPAGDRYNFEIIFDKKIDNHFLDPQRCLGIDIGLNNLVTTSNNIGLRPIIIKGGILKSINQFYNKMKAKYTSQTKKINGNYTSLRLLKLNRKRKNKIQDFFHKSTRKIIDYCIINNINTIIIGYNELWKQKVKIGKKNNQKFVQVPFHKFLLKLEYKAELVGITVKRVSEEYTSQMCSNCGVISKKNRKFRGLYVCSNFGSVLNADVNGASNILRKVIPKSSWIGDRGHLNCPVSITV